MERENGGGGEDNLSVGNICEIVGLFQVAALGDAYVMLMGVKMGDNCELFWKKYVFDINI